jgi:predicted small secreted protein
MKKKIMLVLALILAVCLLAACGGGGGGGLGDVSVGGNGSDGSGSSDSATDGTDEEGSSEMGSGLTSAGRPGDPSVRLVEYIIAPLDECFGGKFHYEYDDANSLIKITGDGVGANSGVWEVTYPDENTVRYDNKEKDYHFVMTFDGDYVAHFEGTLQGMPVVQDLQYDADYLIQTDSNSGGVNATNYYIWNDSVLDTIDINVMGMSVKTNYTYGDIPNLATSISPWITSHQGNWYSPTYFTGNSSPFLVTSEVTSMTGQKITWRYTLDADGYVTEVYKTEAGADEILLYEVIYYE